MGRQLELWMELAPATATKADALRSLDRAHQLGLLSEDLFFGARDALITNQTQWGMLRAGLTQNANVKTAGVLL